MFLLRIVSSWYPQTVALPFLRGFSAIIVLMRDVFPDPTFPIMYTKSPSLISILRS